MKSKINKIFIYFSIFFYYKINFDIYLFDFQISKLLKKNILVGGKREKKK